MRSTGYPRSDHLTFFTAESNARLRYKSRVETRINASGMTTLTSLSVINITAVARYRLSRVWRRTMQVVKRARCRGGGKAAARKRQAVPTPSVFVCAARTGISDRQTSYDALIGQEKVRRADRGSSSRSFIPHRHEANLKSGWMRACAFPVSRGRARELQI